MRALRLGDSVLVGKLEFSEVPCEQKLQLVLHEVVFASEAALGLGDLGPGV